MNSYDFTKCSIEEYSKMLASSSHIPGGGSVSGICANFAVSLAMMIFSISISSADEEQQADYQALEMDRIKLFELINLDSERFDLLMKTFKLPKSTEEEKEIRSKKIKEAYIEAAFAPYQIYLIMQRTGAFLQKYKDQIKSSVMADLLLSEDLIKLASSNCLENIAANKLSLEECERLFSDF